MIVTTVSVQVKPENIGQFIEATVKNHECALQEPGNLRFDILQNTDDPSKFLLYEAYESEEGAAAHKKTIHYLQWKAEVSGWMEKPREGTPYKVVRPIDKTMW
jgi:autoinducer 2-degrading protein